MNTGAAPFSSHRSQAIAASAWLLLAWSAGVVLAASSAIVIGDEWVHWAQVRRFLAGDLRLLTDYLTTVPGYHALLALLLAATDAPSLGLARALSALSGPALVAALLQIRRALGDRHPALPCAQVLVLPVLFPYLFLVYTDALALALLLWALAGALRGRHGWAALALGGSMLVRQHHVFFTLLLAAIALQQSRAGAGWRQAWTAGDLRGTAPYLLPLAGFLAFWWWNGSISLSTPQSAAHPDVTIDAGNPAFVLLLAALLLPLQLLAGLRRFLASAAARPWLWLLPVGVLVAFLATFAVTHPYNFAVPEFSLRNGALAWISTDRGAFSIMAVIVTLSACGFAWLPLLRPQLRWALPLALLFVAGSWMIETRYAIVPLALLLALRRQAAPWVEWATLAAWTVLSLWATAGLYSQQFGL